MPDPEFTKLLNQTVHIAAYVSISPAGDGVYGDPMPVRARVEPNTKLLDNAPTGEEVVSQFRIFTLAVLGLKDHLWLPGADPTNNALARMPKSITLQADEDGTLSHFEVYV